MVEGHHQPVIDVDGAVVPRTALIGTVKSYSAVKGFGRGPECGESAGCTMEVLEAKALLKVIDLILLVEWLGDVGGVVGDVEGDVVAGVVGDFGSMAMTGCIHDPFLDGRGCPNEQVTQPSRTPVKISSCMPPVVPVQGS